MHPNRQHLGDIHPGQAIVFVDTAQHTEYRQGNRSGKHNKGYPIYSEQQYKLKGLYTKAYEDKFQSLQVKTRTKNFNIAYVNIKTALLSV